MSYRGFTLIELLVVISIIGTLSSIVLSSVSTARGKGNDAAIKQDLSQMPAAVELGRLDNQTDYQTYVFSCSTTPATYGGNAGAFFTDAVSKSDHQAGSGVCVDDFESNKAPPFNPGSMSGRGVKYTVNSSGAITVSSATLYPWTLTSYWAAAVRLSTGEYFCVDGTGAATTTPTLTIGSSGDFVC